MKILLLLILTGYSLAMEYSYGGIIGASIGGTICYNLQVKDSGHFNSVSLTSSNGEISFYIAYSQECRPVSSLVSLVTSGGVLNQYLNLDVQAGAIITLTSNNNIQPTNAILKVSYTSNTEKKATTAIGAIIGGIVGGIFLCCCLPIISIIVCCCIKKKRAVSGL